MSIVEALKKMLPPARIDTDALAQQVQRQIVTQYRLARGAGITPYSRIADAGFRLYSQFEEDGILLYVLSMIGFRSKRVVEMCCGTGDECMAANLVLNHGFDGVLFDGDARKVERAKAFFAAKKDCLLYPPTMRQAWITRDNVNDLLKEAGADGEVDLFSLDMDGNDYWIWKAIEVTRPRLLVCETHNVIPGDLSLTVEYRPDFAAEGDYLGVSLLAMTKLCAAKGYRLIGAHRHGFNAFFLRNDEGTDVFPEVSIAEVHDNHWTRLSQATRWPRVKDTGWVSV